MTGCSDEFHIDQSPPFEWHAVEYGNRTFVIRDIPEGSVELYVVSSRSRNVRTFAKADAALYEGNVVSTYYDEDLGSVEFSHDYAGTVGRHGISEWLDAPAVRLKRLPTTSPSSVLKTEGH